MFYLIPFLTSFVLSVIATPLIRAWALKHDIIDQPRPDKIHKKPTALLGGIAVFSALAISAIIFLQLGWLTDRRITSLHVYAIILSGLVLIIGGFLDDRYNLKPYQQIISPIIAAAITVAAGVAITFVTNPLGGILEIGGSVGMILAFGWLLGMMYTTKLLDGLDGLVSGVSVIGSLIIFLVSLYWDVPLSGTSVLALIFAGAVFGFLLFNWHPARIFLGEGGSVLCGYMLGVLAIISGSKIATALLIMGIPILDVIWIIIRRTISGQGIAHGDHKHLHFRLLAIGLSHRQSVLFLYVMTAGFGLSSLFLASYGKVLALMAMLGFMIFLGTSLFIIYRLKNKNHAPNA